MKPEGTVTGRCAGTTGHHKQRRVGERVEAGRSGRERAGAGGREGTEDADRKAGEGNHKRMHTGSGTKTMLLIKACTANVRYNLHGNAVPESWWHYA